MHKWFHASPGKFKHGDILGQPVVDWVFLTNEIRPHATLADVIVRDNWYIYEVEPLGPVWSGYCAWGTTRNVVRWRGRSLVLTSTCYPLRNTR